MAEDESPDLFAETTADVRLGPDVGLAAPPAGNRYVLLEPLGTGGSAIVYTAYDRKLDRKIAIKLLREEGGPDAQARLLREAQTLARLRHPNVVTVHDTGTFGTQVFIAMELVEGVSLRRWLAAKPRRWRELLGVFLDAGRGLAAAHAQGLVHRDFKPDNVLIGNDGAVRVVDFGLAGAPDELETGPIVGTPRYMAPEQRAGAKVDARADQFAFCVALRGALDRRPRIPRRIHAILRRGVNDDADARYPTMDALLGELARVPVMLRRRVLGAAVLAAAAALAAMAVTRHGTATDNPCADAEDRLTGAWDGTVRASMRGAFLSTGRPHAEDTFQRVARRLDDYAAQWAAMRTEACEATHVRHEQSDALFDLRMDCLDRRRSALASLTAVLGKLPDPKVLNRAVFAVGELDEVADCADREALTAAMPPPAPALRPQVLSLRARIDTAQALQEAGMYRQSAALVESLATEARSVAYPPVQLAALRVLFFLQWRGEGNLAAARRTAAETLLAAARARDDATAARIWADLLHLESKGERPAAGLALFAGAEAAAARAGDQPVMRGRTLEAEAVVLHAVDDLDGAKRSFMGALREIEHAPQPDERALAMTLANLGNTLMDQGNYDAARDAYQRALMVSVQLLGPDHPWVANDIISLGAVLGRLGKPEEARQHYERALAMRVRIEGPDGAGLAILENNLAALALQQERYDEGLRRAERALALYEHRLGSEHRELANSHVLVALFLCRQARPGDAALHAERALALARKGYGPDHIEVVKSLAVLADAHLGNGALREALARVNEGIAMAERLADRDPLELGEVHELRAQIHAARGRTDLAAEDDARALAIYERHARGLFVARSLTALGERYVALGRAAEAAPLLERAMVLQEATGAGPITRSRARFALARARWDGGDRAAALRLADDAEKGYAALGVLHEKDRLAVERWRRARQR